MNRDSEALQRSLLKLIQEIIPDASLADVEALSQKLNQEPTIEDLDPNASNVQDVTSVTPSQSGSDTLSFQRKSSLELGDTPAVQDRFHALLKRRLESEIQRNPPLFPWETEIHDYETEPALQGVLAAEAPSAASNRMLAPLWLNQLRALSLPVAVPDAVLTQLFQRCQEMVHSSLLEGAKLVRAVEELFPDHAPTLNHLAGLVMTSPARSTPEVLQGPNSYEEAVPVQQMVLSLMAAREILGYLTLTVSSEQPVTERQWLTEVGALALRAEYAAGQMPSHLRVQGRLPCAGSLQLRGNGLQAIAQRLDAGPLSVELFDVQPHQPYTLEVQFADQQQAPLTFAIPVIP